MADRYIGVDWADLGKNVFGGVHVAGRIVASAFGGAGLADAAEQLEGPILPEWAKRGQAADIRIFDGMALSAVTASNTAKAKKETEAKDKPSVKIEDKKPDVKDVPDNIVQKPDFFALVHDAAKGADQPSWAQATAVGIWGGKRFLGSKPPYSASQASTGPGKLFSFGYSDPTRVDVITESGGKVTTTSMKDIRQIIFAGGTEVRGSSTIVGGGETLAFWNRQLYAGTPVKRWHAALGVLGLILVAAHRSR